MKKSKILLVIITLLTLMVPIQAVSAQPKLSKIPTTITGLQSQYNQTNAININVSVTPADGRDMYLAYYNQYTKKWIRVKTFHLPNQETATISTTLTGQWRVFDKSMWRLRVPGNSQYAEKIVKTNVINDITPNAKSSCVYDVRNKKFIFAENVTQAWRLSSITKLMSSVLLVENAKMTDKITAKKSCNGCSIHLKPGDKYNMKTALAGMLLASANDAAVNMGETLKTKINKHKTFPQIMNERARMLGMKHTNYVNAAGNISTSPIVDQVKLMSYIINTNTPKMNILKNMIVRPSYVGKINKSPITITNTNQILGRDYCIWGKGGVIGPSSGYCFASYFVINNNPYVSIVYGCTPEEFRWIETEALYNYAKKSINNRYAKIAIS